MGKFSSMFKKSDDKSKEPNPYAQQQSSAPSAYGDQATQYNGNQYFQAPARGPTSGLPSGPRPGGLPGSVAPGASRAGTWETDRTYSSDRTAPPQYSAHSPEPPAYHPGRASPHSTGGTPSPSTAASSPSLNSGYPREKLGATDGFGGARFGPPAPAPSGPSAMLPPQHKGRYGDLDSESRVPPVNYTGPTRQSPNPAQTRADPMKNAPNMHNQALDNPEWTPEERDQARYDELNQQAKHYRGETKASLQRSLATVQTADGVSGQISEQLQSQTDHIRKAKQLMMETNAHIREGEVKITSLGNAQSMASVFWDRKVQTEAVNQRYLNQLMEKDEKETEQRRIRQVDARAAQNARNNMNAQALLGKRDPSDRSRFTLEAEDDADEEDIEQLEQEVLKGVIGLKLRGIAQGELLSDNLDDLKQLDQATTKAQDGILKSHNRLRKFED